MMNRKIILCCILLLSKNTSCQESTSFYSRLTKKSIIAYMVGLGFISGCIYGICKKYPENAIVRHLKRSYSYLKNRFWDSEETTSSKANTITTKTQETNLSIEKSKLENLQEQLLLWLEQDINAIFNSMPNNLKQYLPQWNENFKRGQEICPLLHSEDYNLDYIDFFYTAIGLKPISVIQTSYIDIFKFNFEKLEQLYPNTFYFRVNTIVKKGPYQTLDSEQKPSSYLIIQNKSPFFSINFINEIYNNVLTISNEFKNDFLQQDKKIHGPLLDKWTLKHLTNNLPNIELTNDEEALFLGYQPLVFAVWIDKTNSNKEMFLLKNHEKNFRYALLPGIVKFDDQSFYMKLYSRLAEYYLIKNTGIQSYLKILENKILLIIQNQDLKKLLISIKEQDKGADLLLQAIELIQQ